MAGYPTGTVTFLITDIEGSTSLVQQLGEAYRDVLAHHDRILRHAVERHDGIVVSTQGDSFFCVFTGARRAVEAALDLQRGLLRHPWDAGAEIRVRAGLHSGEGVLGGEDYTGVDVHIAARIADAGAGGQTLLSSATWGLVEDRLPDGCSTRDLGRHHLRGLWHEEHIYQLDHPDLPSEFPPLRHVASSVSSLPTHSTSFVGREKELADIEQLLAGTRLLTLTGPGGTGKTRLAVEAARRLAGRFPAGVVFVDLAAVTDPDLVLPGIATQLEIQHTAGSTIEALTGHLRDKSVLIVLDNFEQVVEAARSISELVSGTSAPKVLVTSRVPLHVDGEQEYEVAPLAVPAEAGGYAGSPAVELFVERARLAKPEFRIDEATGPIVGQIVARVDGLPLAVELAASRIKILPLGALLDRLDRRMSLLKATSADVPERQRTLRDLISWSYELLDDRRKRFFAWLAPFAGGAWFRQIVAVAAEPDDDDLDVLESLAVLVDHSLVRLADEDEPRYRLLETIREFAFACLEERGEVPEARRRHAHAYLDLATEASQHLTRHDQLEWLTRLERDHDNLRAAQTWALIDEPETAQRIAAALWRFWHMRGHLDEARTRLDEALAYRDGDRHVLIAALEAAGGVAYWAGRMSDAAGYYRECVELAREAGDRPGEANALYNLAFALLMDAAEVVELFREALAIYRELDDEPGIAKSLWGLGDAYIMRGDPEGGRGYLDESVEIFERLDDPFGLGWAIFLKGYLEMSVGDEEAAGRHLARSFEVFAPARDVSAIVLHTSAFAALALRTGDERRAARLIGARAALSKMSGTGLDLLTLDQVREAQLTMEATTDPDLVAERTAGRDLDLDEVIGLVREGFLSRRA